MKIIKTNAEIYTNVYKEICDGSDFLSDVTIVNNGNFIKLHRLVLSMNSSYFKKMFSCMTVSQHVFGIF